MPWKHILDHTGALPALSDRVRTGGKKSLALSIDGDVSDDPRILATVSVEPGLSVTVPLKRRDDGEGRYMDYLLGTTAAYQIPCSGATFLQVEVTGVSSGQIDIWAWDAVS